MQEYDVALKNVLTRGAFGFLSRLLGMEIAQFLNTELPMVRKQRADLLMEAHDGTLLHVELQSSNGQRIAIRMLDYLVAIESKYERVPRQLVLYVGEAPMRMNGGSQRPPCLLKSPSSTFEILMANPCWKAITWKRI